MTPEERIKQLEKEVEILKAAFIQLSKTTSIGLQGLIAAQKATDTRVDSIANLIFDNENE